MSDSRTRRRGATRAPSRPPRKQSGRQAGKPATTAGRDGGRRARPRLWVGIGVAALLLVSALAVLSLRPDREAPGLPPAVPDLDTSTMQPSVRSALERSRRAVEADPGSAEAWGRHGATLDAHEMLAEAELCYRNALTLAPRDYRWPFLLAYTVEMQGGDPEEVEELYLAAAALRPSFLPAHYRLGQAQARRGRLEQALAAFQRALAINPDLAIVHRGIAQVRLASGEVEAAVEQFNLAEASEPGNAEVLAGLSQAYMRLGKVALAEEAAARSRSASRGLSLPDPIRGYVKSLGMGSEACLSRAQQSLRRRQYSAAVADLKVVLETRAEDAAVHELLGRAYGGDGREDLAERHYLRAIELDPERANAHAALGQAYARGDRVELGIEHLVRATQLTPDNGSFHAALAMASARAGRTAEALAAFERAAELTRLTPRARQTWGELLLEAGEPGRALEQFQGVLEALPDDADARAGVQQARGRLGAAPER